MASFEIKHQFVSPKPNGSETDLIRPSDWNAEHEFILTGSGAVARLGQGTGSAEFVPFGTGANEIPLNSHLGSAAYATLGSAIGNALQVVDVGEGVAGLPVIDGRNIVNLTLPDPEGTTLPDGTLSQKGIVQLTNSFTSTSQTLAVTPKALSDGLATKSEIFTGSNSLETNYPIGHTMLALHTSTFSSYSSYTPPKHNQLVTPRRQSITATVQHSGGGNQNSGQWTPVQAGDTLGSGWSSLTGTWRISGMSEGPGPSASDTSYSTPVVIRRVA